MSPRAISTNIQSPTPQLFTSTSRRVSSRVNKPATFSKATQNADAALETSISQSGRPRRMVAPTERGVELISTTERRKARQTRRAEGKALETVGSNAPKRKGKRGTSASKSQRLAVGTDEAEENSDGTGIDDTEGDSETDDGHNDSDLGDNDYGVEVVPTPETRKLVEKITGETYRDELSDPTFSGDLVQKLNEFLKDEAKRKEYSVETLQEVLRFVRRAPSVSYGTSQRSSSFVTLPEEALSGGRGYHKNYEPQPGKKKRRLEASQAEASKRSCAAPPKTPTTVPDMSLPLFGVPLLDGQPDDWAPVALPTTAARHCDNMPKALPRSKAVYIPSQSPSPLPAAFRQVLDNTQTMPEDTRTEPEDTEVEYNDAPVPGIAHPDPAPSSPDLGAPLASRSLVPSSSISLGGKPSAPAASTIASRPTASSQPDANFVEQIEAMANRFNRNEKFRARAAAILKSRRASLRLVNEDDDAMEEDVAIRADARNTAQGKPNKRKRKTGLNCAAMHPRQVSGLAITDMNAFLFAVGPFVPRTVITICALEAFDRAAKIEFPNIDIGPPSADLVGAIADRAANARTVLKCDMRPLMTSKDGYGFHAHPTSQLKIDENVALYNSLRENFHYGSLDDPKSHYEHPALKEGFVTAFFNAAHSPCAIYHHYFSPVSPQTFGVLLTMIESCIAEWRTGVHVKENLCWKEQGAMYEKHMLNLRVFAGEAAGRFLRMRQDFYDAGYKSIYKDDDSDSGQEPKPTIRREDIRPDTPPPPPTGNGVGVGVGVEGEDAPGSA